MLNENYLILEKIGHGGFGKVYVAEDELANRHVAIKILHSTEQEDQQDLIQEIQYLTSLNHSSIVTFYHHFYDGDSLCLVMEYCINGSLYDKIENEGKQSFDYAVDVGCQIAEVLEYVHSKGIIHHDIKSQNILFDEEDNLRVGDFGIANSRGGTITHLAPEFYFADDSSIKDPRVDVYALGITILEIVMGCSPFSETSKKNILSKKMSHTFIPSTLPEWFQEIIIKATHPNPELRFQNMTEFKQALKAKSAPLTINYNRIKTSKIVVAAANNLNRKKWGKTISFIDRALEMDSSSVLALITAGRYYLKIYNIEKAQYYFEKALLNNPSADVKKELAEINISQNIYSKALSLLQNHIQLYPTDWESYNLIVECYYRLGRFETALELVEGVLSEIKLDYFRNNWLIINYCMGNFDCKTNIKNNPFIIYNRSLLLDEVRSWSDSSTLSNKFIFQSNRFARLKKNNTIKLSSSNGEVKEFTQPIITIGRNNENEIVFNNNTISRRHCVIINYPQDVWIYDLGSTLGTYVDGKRIEMKLFLLGKHEIKIGNKRFDLFTSSDVLI